MVNKVIQTGKILRKMMESITTIIRMPEMIIKDMLQVMIQVLIAMVETFIRLAQSNIRALEAIITITVAATRTISPKTMFSEVVFPSFRPTSSLAWLDSSS